MLGSQSLGLGSVDTAAEVDGGGGGGGGGTLTNVTSADGSVVVTSPTTSTRDLSENGVYQLIDSYGVVNDAPAINAALAALAARPHNNGVLEGPAGTHLIGSQITVPLGCSMVWAGKGASMLDVRGNGYDAINITNGWGSRLKYFTMICSAGQRASGNAIHVVGGNPAIQPFAPTYTLSAAETEIDQVDMDQQFTGCLIENSAGPPVRSSFLVYIRNGRWGRVTDGGNGLWINCPAPTNGNQYGASHFVQRLQIYGHAGDTSNAAFRLTGTGDATIEKCQTFNTDVGLLLDTPANGRLSTLRFLACQFDTSTSYNVHATMSGSAITDDISFEQCWFAGAGIHGILVQSFGAKGWRIMNSKFFFAAQYGMVVTGDVNGPPKRFTLIGNDFNGAGVGGFRAVQGSKFILIGNRFAPSELGLPATMPQAITMDAGTSDFIIEGNDWTEAVAGLLDNSGDVTKSIGGNIPTSMLEIVAKFSGVIITSGGGATSTQLGDPGSQPAIAANSSSNVEYPTSARTIRRLRVCAESGNGATPYTVTLYKRPVGGALAATAMQITVPGGAAAGATFVDSAHPITFADGDTYALQVNSAATGEGPKLVQAVLEGPPPGP